MQYVFTAVYTKGEGETLHVSFPDFPECSAQGEGMLDAAKKAETVLHLCLFDMEQQGVLIPKMKDPGKIEVNPGDVISMVVVDTDPYHSRFAHSVQCTLSVPSWIEDAAGRTSLDLSQVLHDAVRREIGMPVHDVPTPTPAPDVQNEEVAQDVLLENNGNQKVRSGGRKVANAIMIGLLSVLVIAALLLAGMVLTPWLDNVPVIGTVMQTIETRMNIDFIDLGLGLRRGY